MNPEKHWAWGHAADFCAVCGDMGPQVQRHELRYLAHCAYVTFREMLCTTCAVWGRGLICPWTA